MAIKKESRKNIDMAPNKKSKKKERASFQLPSYWNIFDDEFDFKVIS